VRLNPSDPQPTGPANNRQPLTFTAARDRLISAASRKDLPSYVTACYLLLFYFSEASDPELQSLFDSDFIPFLQEQIQAPFFPDALGPTLLMLSGLLISSSPVHSQLLLEAGVIDLLGPLLSIPDPTVLSHALTCIGCVLNSFAQLRIDYHFPIDAGLLERIVADWPELKADCLQVAPYLLAGAGQDEYSLGLLRFLVVNFEPRYPSNWVFPVLIAWVKSFPDLMYGVFIDTGFLTEKLPRYIKPTLVMVKEELGTMEEKVGVREDLQSFSIRLLCACFRWFPEYRARFQRIVLPKYLVSIVNSPRTVNCVLAAGLKLMAELCTCEKTREFVEMVDLAKVIDRILQNGKYRSRINFWRLARAWIGFASRRAREFLLHPRLLAQAAEEIDQGAPKHMLVIIEFLIAVCAVTKEIERFEITTAFGTKEFMERLSHIQEEHPKTVLSERALALIEMLHLSS
jgi:hypothetical protein